MVKLKPAPFVKFAFTLFSFGLLFTLCDAIADKDGISMFKFLPHEIRAGTAAAMAGFPLVPYLPENAINMQWSPLTPTGYGLFHPVKQ